MNLKEEVSKNVNIIKTTKFSKLSPLMKRVLRDIKMYEGLNPKLPNIEVAPLEDNILEWHGNIKGGEDTIYKNGIYHFKLLIPENYPKVPPKIKILTPVKHPNIINSEICLDIWISDVKNKDYLKCWNQTYTLTSIFMQLHNFFNEGNSKLGYLKAIDATRKKLEKNKIKLKEVIEKKLSKLKSEFPENVNNILKNIEELNVLKINESFDEIIKEINTSKLYKVEEYIDSLMEKYKYYEKEEFNLKTEDKKLENILKNTSLLNKEMVNIDSIFKLISTEKIKKIKILSNKLKSKSLDKESDRLEIEREIKQIVSSNANQMKEVSNKINDLQNTIPENLKVIFDDKIKLVISIKNDISESFKNQINEILTDKKLIIQYEKYIDDIQKEIENKVKNFHCFCGHGKLLSDKTRVIKPIIKEINKEDFINKNSQKTLYEEELRCFYNNISFKECNLGLGIRVSKKPITGEIRMSEPSNCLISLNTFQKDFVRKDLFGNKFNYYFPLFTGDYNKEAEEKLTLRSCSYILKNSSDRIDKNDLRQVLPTLLYGCFMNILDQKIFPDHSYIRIIINLLIKNIKLFNDDKEYETNVLELIDNFKNDEKSRHKDVTPNLINICIQSILLKKFSDIKEFILEELEVRQVFWIMTKIKGFEKFERLSDKTLDYIFEQCRSGYLIYSIIYTLNSLFDKHYSNRKKALIYGSENYGLLNYEFENKFHNKLLKILSMKKFKQFFTLIKKSYSVEYLEVKFKENIDISKKKGYHGNVDKYLGLKTIETQYAELTENNDDFLEILKDNTIDMDKYKKLLFKNFPQVERLNNQCKIPLDKIMKKLDYINNLELLENELNDNEYNSIKNNYLKNYKKNSLSYKYYKKEFNFKDAYIKLSLEKELKYLFLKKNLKRIHMICNLIEDYEIDCLVLPCININKIKSKYYYINVIINKLKNVKNIILKPVGNNFNIRYFNELEKSFTKKFETNFTLNSLNIYYLDNFQGNNDKKDLFKIINNIYSRFDSLKCIKWFESNILQEYKNKKLFLNILIKNKNLKEINISGPNFNCGDLFEGLIDGLMKSKSIENIILKNLFNNKELIELFLYNLTFSMNLKYLNLEGINNSTLNDKFWSNLGKLVSISNDLIKLNLKNFKSNKFISNFLNNIGLSNSLKYLNLSNIREGININELSLLGKNIAFNSKLTKTNAIEELYLDNILKNETKTESFFSGLQISNKELAIFEGEEEIANNLSNKHKILKVCNKLKILSIQNSYFKKNIDISFKIKNGQKIPFIEFLRYSNQLEYLNINNSITNGSIINLIWGAYNQNLYDDLNKNSRATSRLDNKFNKYYIEEENKADNLNFNKFLCNPQLKVLLMDNIGIANDNIKNLNKILNFLKNLEILSLRKNLVGISLQNLSKSLNINLKVLDLYKNMIGIDGARKLSESISKSNLEYLDLGFNNIKNKGILEIVDQLIKNKNNKLKYLGISHNNFKDNTIEYIIDNIENKNLNLEGILCKHNLYNNFNINSNYNKSLAVSSFFDCFNKLKYFPKDRFERMLWIPKYFTKSQIINMLSNIIKKNNLIENLVINVFNKIDYKKNHKEKGLDFTFVEFINEFSVKKVIHLAQRKRIKELSNLRVYKACTSTYNYTKFKKRKEIKLEVSTLQPQTNRYKPKIEVDANKFDGKKKYRKVLLNNNYVKNSLNISQRQAYMVKNEDKEVEEQEEEFENDDMFECMIQKANIRPNNNNRFQNQLKKNLKFESDDEE